MKTFDFTLGTRITKRNNTHKIFELKGQCI